MPSVSSRLPWRQSLCAFASTTLLAILVTGAVGCENRFALVDPAAPDSSAGGGGGTVQKATLSVVVAVALEDSSLASALGLKDARLENAEVTIRRSGSTSAPQVDTTDAAGTARFEDVLPGTYTLSALRRLTPDEIARLGPQNSDVNGFGGAAVVSVAAPATERSIAAAAGRRGSLVISEFSLPIARLASGEDYRHGQWIELYNNSDTIIFLDGKVIFRGQVFGVRDRPPLFPCGSMDPWQLDRDGIWTRFIEAFPGSGQTYPLSPGKTVVVAMDAIDHRTIHPGLQDLSRADFELLGSADVDNPVVPNMVTLGDVFGSGILTHGMEFGLVDLIVAVADPVDVGSLVQDNLPNVVVPRYWRIPREKILDVVSATQTPEVEANQTFLSPQCGPFTHENLDRQQAPLINHEALNSIRRRVFTTRSDGRVILQRTKTSARDFEAARPTAGTVP